MAEQRIPRPDKPNMDPYRQPKSDIEVTERNDRGLHQYGDPVATTYGHKVVVYESSAASGPHCWLRTYVEGGEADGESMGAHLSLENAVAVRDRLAAFIDEVPSRWAD